MDEGRVRHASLGEQSHRQSDCETQFPSSELNAEDFINIGWQDNCHTTDAGIKAYLRKLLSSIPRKAWFILVSIFIVIILLLAIFIVLILVLHIFPHHKNPSPQNDVNTTTVPITPSSTTISTESYPIGYVTGSQSRFLLLNASSVKIIPDYRAYNYRNRLMAYSNESIFIINQTEIKTIPMADILPVYENCQLLALSDACLDQGDCDRSSAIYCCDLEFENETSCSIHGLKVENTYSYSVEQRISSDGMQLLQTMQNIYVNDEILQVERINQTGDIHIGAPQTFNEFKGYPFISSVADDPDSSHNVSFIVGFDSRAKGLVIVNHSNSTNVFLNDIDNDDVISLTTSRFQEHVLIALLELERLYVFRYNPKNNCLSVLVGNKYHSFLYPGLLTSSFWINDAFLIFYIEMEGINLVQFNFAWSDDTLCDLT